jgi:hypothetical protein
LVARIPKQFSTEAVARGERGLQLLHRPGAMATKRGSAALERSGGMAIRGATWPAGFAAA